MFITFMDYCGNLVQESVDGEIFGYADDLALISESREVLQRFILAWDEVLFEKGMKINRGKTEVMMVSREQEELNIELEGEVLKQTEQFEYLGVYSGVRNDMFQELKYRIGKI